MIKLLRIITRKNLAIFTIIVVLSLLIACSDEPTESLHALEEMAQSICEESIQNHEIGIDWSENIATESTTRRSAHY